MNKPLIAITMGDPAGVGPEVIVSSWENREIHSLCRRVVLGHPEILRRAVALLRSSLEVVEVSAPEEASADPAIISCLPCGPKNVVDVQPATIDPRAGKAAYDALTLATELALAKRVDGITTAPLNKAALWEAGYQYPGHTELLAELCGVRDFAMMLYLAPGRRVRGSAGLGVVHVTLHTALRNVFSELTTQAIVDKTRLVGTVMKELLGSRSEGVSPKIGVCALNPHASEQGLFGDEEKRIIAPAVQQSLAEGLSVQGPLPADTLMGQAVAGDFDAVVAMYHDQGHIALKLLDMHHAVNITLGLPIVRTSVAHGTAFDLAWQGQVKSSGMIEATRVAALLIEKRACQTNQSEVKV